jgi:hypothetical protein
VPASATSSVLRLARPVRAAYLAALPSPVVLFVPPVGVRGPHAHAAAAGLPLPHRPRGVPPVGAVLDGYRRRGARFATMRDLARGPAAAA